MSAILEALKRAEAQGDTRPLPHPLYQGRPRRSRGWPVAILAALVTLVAGGGYLLTPWAVESPVVQPASPPAPRAVPQPVSTPAAAPRPAASREEISLEKEPPPAALKVQAIFWDPDPDRRMGVGNGRILRAWDELRGYALVKIGKKSLIFNRLGREYCLQFGHGSGPKH